MKIEAVVVVGSLALVGCAQKSYVQREVGEVNKKVDAVASEVEKTQARVARAETRIDAVDKSAQSGVAEAKGSAEAAMSRAKEAEKTAKGKVTYNLTLSDDKVRFPVKGSELSDEAKALIDQLVLPIKAENRGVFFEIEGHTDSTGSEEFNNKLGEERAMAVRNYLAMAHGIALSRISVISYGSSKPVADNKTRENRAQNRRVVVRVVE
jgi:outer membrane protein OmpA-like peptidoglycan-associated protein